MSVLVTGAAGLVGRALVERMVRERRPVRAAIRRAHVVGPTMVDTVVSDVGPDTDWTLALAGATAVVHLAARVHVMRETDAHPIEAFRRVNVAGTLNLARQAAESGVRQFVYLSSVKVHGESGSYSESDPPAPKDAYGVSKHEAEVGLATIAAGSGMSTTIIRPPLVYGPGVRANFHALIRAIARGLPLPLGAIHNRRSLVGVDNLVDFILTCLEHPAAANETFLVSDGEDLSTTDLVRRMARAMERPARLISVPAPMLMAAATLVGRRDVARRLLDSLSVDITKARQHLGWVPPISVDEGLRRAAVLH
jgi:nucleoside-diphosphate-sugar epimerase